MKKIIPLFAILLMFQLSLGQTLDVGITKITAPVSTCALTTTEDVTIAIYNYEDTLKIPNDTMVVSYVINGGTPVTDTIKMDTILPNSSYTYTFTTKANLATPGTYTIDAYTTLAGDVNVANNGLIGYQVISDTISVGGAASSNATVCSGSNSGTLTLSGNNGSVIRWESSINNGSTWATIANTTTTQTYTNRTTTTLYRAVVASGTCSSANSSEATITVDPTSIGGAVSNDSTVCSGGNNGTLTLSGNIGSVVRWEYSTDNAYTWVNITNTTTTQTYNNLTATTLYRAVVKSGLCSSANSSAATITVDPISVGGTLGDDIFVCSGLSEDTLTLTAYTGSILSWQSLVDTIGATWETIANTTDTLTYIFDTTRTYRIIVKSGVCPVDTSVETVVTIHPTPVAIFSAADVCIGDTTYFVNTSSGNIQHYKWDFTDNTASIAVSPKHFYEHPSTNAVTLTVISNKNCVHSVTNDVIVNPLPNADITANGITEFCLGGSVILSAPSAMSVYAWSDTSSTESITVTLSGDYAVTVTDANGCMNADTMTVTVYPLPIAVAGNDTTISLGHTVELDGDGGEIYSWLPTIGLDNPNSETPVADPTTTTTYAVLVTDSNGCQDTDSMTISILIDYNFIFSNLMTPNSDGQNDTWYIDNILAYPDCEIFIYNRYGKEIYTASSYTNDWDGTVNGNLLPDGAYYYVVKCPGSEKIFKGAITIIRGE